MLHPETPAVSHPEKFAIETVLAPGRPSTVSATCFSFGPSSAPREKLDERARNRDLSHPRLRGVSPPEGASSSYANHPSGDVTSQKPAHSFGRSRRATSARSPNADLDTRFADRRYLLVVGDLGIDGSGFFRRGSPLGDVASFFCSFAHRRTDLRTICAFARVRSESPSSTMLTSRLAAAAPLTSTIGRRRTTGVGSRRASSRTHVGWWA